MRCGEDCTLFFPLFPPTRLSICQPSRCSLLTIKEEHRFKSTSVIITRFSSETMKLHQSLLTKIVIFIAMFFFHHLYTCLLLSRIYCSNDPNKCNFLFTNLRSALNSKLFSRLASTYLFISRSQSSHAASHLAASFLT